MLFSPEAPSQPPTGTTAVGPSDDFIAMAAHELRGPATVIAGVAEMLRQSADAGALGEQGRELLELLVRNSRHLRKLTVDVLSSVYLERGDLPVEMGTAPLLPIIRWGVEGASAGDEVRIECDSELTAQVDADHLERIVTNLVANALQHGGAPVVVSARALERSDTATISVRDFGQGVATDRSHLLFERFSPLAARTSTSTGLGLSIARGLARAMGGDLTYRPADPGSVFTVTLRASRM
ncbi:MAG TPA: HAMP domain-containing sensor histidine kinase [Acidimicrobiales bacterium]|nr:HAMP domain-containing sensor histidine kinase [Acidimicrobiales bacterium]